MPSRSRSSLPFGAVMATGAASQLAGSAKVGWLGAPLLLVAMAIALTVIGLGMRAPSRSAHYPAARLGDFTIPIGLAVIGNSVAQFGGPVLALGAAVIVASAWAYTGLLVFSVVLPLLSPKPGLQAVDGTWFLAPAALLADGIGVASVAVRLPRPFALLGWLAFASVTAGVVGYLVVAGLAVARVARHGLAGAPSAPWWIAAGCGGLSAAALGRSSAVFPAGHGAELLHAFGVAALALWMVGTAALLPVLAGSIRYGVGVRRLAGRPPWPPAFSTGVYALGAGQVSRLLGVPVIAAVAAAAAVATLFFWLFTVAAHLPRLPMLFSGFHGEFEEPVQ